MSAYEVVLFLHLVAVVATFAASGILHLAMFELRTARSVAELRTWARLQRRFGQAMPVGVVALFATGAYLVQDAWTWDAAWVEASIAGLVALSVLGAVSGARAGRAMGPALARAGDGAPSPELERLVRGPEAWIASHVTTMLALAVVWIMVRKPELGECLAALAVAVVVGAASALPFCRPAQASASRGAAATR